MITLNIINIHTFPQKDWTITLHEYISFNYGDIVVLTTKKGETFTGRITRKTAIKYYINEKLITLSVTKWRPTKIWILDKLYQLFTQRKMYIFDKSLL
jgi:hypothetical protein